MTPASDSRPHRGAWPAVTRAGSRGRASAAGRVVPLSLAFLLGVLGASVGAPARAAETDQLLRVEFTTVTPSVLRPGGTLRLEGKVTNTSDVAIAHAQVHLWRSVEPITDADELATILTSPADVPLGRRLLGTENNNLFALTTEDDPTLDPGETTTFVVQATVDAPPGFTGQDLALEFSTLSAVYPVGIHVRGVPEGSGNQTVARGRILLPYLSKDAQLRHASVVALTAAPSRLPDGTFSNDVLAGELASGGRLRTLLDAALRPGASFVVDPALVEAVQAMTSPYAVLAGNTLVAGTGTAAATAWLADLIPLLTSGVGYRLPYGNPDLRVAAASGDESVRDRALAVLPSSNPAARLPLAILPRDGLVDATLATYLVPMSPAVVFAANTAPASGVLAIKSLVMVGIDESVTTGGPGPEPSTSTPQRVGRLLAGFTLSEQVVATLVDDDQSAGLDAVSAPGLVRVPLPELLALVPSTGSLTAVPEPSVNQGWLGRVAKAEGDITAWAELTGRTTEAGMRANEVLNQALSSDWDGDAGAASTWLNLSLADMGSLLGSRGVNLSISKSFVMSEPTQKMPLTITNSLTVPVIVKVGFREENPQRLTIPDTEPITVAAGESVTVMFQPSASTNGAVAVDAQLITTSGRPIGPSHSFTVTATSLGRVGWIIMAASGIVFLGATSIRIKQVQRERARVAAATAAEHTGDAPLTPTEHPGTAAVPAAGHTGNTAEGGNDE